MEDILTLFDGRPELIEEIKRSPPELATYISLEFQELLSNPNFEYAVSSAANNVRERESVLF